ncbi:MAG: tetratricopeptide repeat protein [Campylobacter sp.]
MNNEEIIQRINELREKRSKNLKSSSENVCETSSNADMDTDAAANLTEKSGAGSAVNLSQKPSSKPSVATARDKQSIKDADLRTPRNNRSMPTILPLVIVCIVAIFIAIKASSRTETLNETQIPTNQANEAADKNPKEISIRTKDSTLKMKNPVRFREDCDGGDGNACAVLSSLLLLNGEISQDGAKDLLKKGCYELNGGESCTRLAGYEDRDSQEGRKLYKKACKLGNGEGCFMFGYVAYFDDNDKEAGAQYFERSCELRFAEACYFLVGIYSNDPAKSQRYQALFEKYQQENDDAIISFRRR